ncbi:hypothetical protein KM043_011851 [Ampulex compressa]|nr:hypothetical protein KM043_011851 [Ampulex compressa]
MEKLAILFDEPEAQHRSLSSFSTSFLPPIVFQIFLRQGFEREPDTSNWPAAYDRPRRSTVVGFSRAPTAAQLASASRRWIVRGTNIVGSRVRVSSLVSSRAFGGFWRAPGKTRIETSPSERRSSKIMADLVELEN